MFEVLLLVGSAKSVVHITLMPYKRMIAWMEQTRRISTWSHRTYARQDDLFSFIRFIQDEEQVLLPSISRWNQDGPALVHDS